MRSSFLPWLGLLASAAGAVAQEDEVEYCNGLPLQQLTKENNERLPRELVMTDCNGFELEEATIAQLQEAMETGRLTSVQLVQCYLKRTFQTKPYLK